MLCVPCYSLFLVWLLDLKNCTLPGRWNGGLQGRVWEGYDDLYLYNGWQSQIFHLPFSAIFDCFSLANATISMWNRNRKIENVKQGLKIRLIIFLVGVIFPCCCIYTCMTWKLLKWNLLNSSMSWIPLMKLYIH